MRTMVSKILARRYARLIGMSLLFISLLAACDAGSRVTHNEKGKTCRVKLDSNFHKFVVEIELACASKGKHCYEITYLSCQGKSKSDAMPINLLRTGDCPGGPWCLSKCSNASPSMWDMPSLLAIDGCNTYTAQRIEGIGRTLESGP